MTGGGQPVPSKVTLIPCTCAAAGTTAAANSTTAIVRQKIVDITPLLLNLKLFASEKGSL
jgi:hypothetical protein